MDADEQALLARALPGARTVRCQLLAGGFRHRTWRLALADGRDVVARFSPTAAVEAAVIRRVAGVVPVPDLVSGADSEGSLSRSAAGAVAANSSPQLPGRVGADESLQQAATSTDGEESVLLYRFVPGRTLAEVLSDPRATDLADLGRRVAEVALAIASVDFDEAGQFSDDALRVRPAPEWSLYLPEWTTDCLAQMPEGRLTAAEQHAWLRLCCKRAPLLARVREARSLVHSDFNPKNLLVRRINDRWEVAAVLDWEFAHSGCPYADPANMLRFANDYPAAFTTAFEQRYSADAPDDDWREIGDTLDLIALSDLLTRPPGHPVTERVVERVRELLRTTT